MTCIVALIQDGRAFMGGDSAALDLSSCGIIVRADEKVFVRGSYLIGFTSSFRMGQLLRYAGSLPSPPVKDLHAFMCTTFINSVRQIFKDGGYGLEEGEAGAEGGEFLVSTHDRLFTIHSDFQVAEPACGYAAIGVGAQLALGSLYSTRSDPEPKHRLTVALEAAETFNGGVRGPFVIRPEDSDRWWKN